MIYIIDEPKIENSIKGDTLLKKLLMRLKVNIRRLPLKFNVLIKKTSALGRKIMYLR